MKTAFIFNTCMIISAMTLTSCVTETGGASLPPGPYSGVDISPTSSIKIGEVYRSSIPLNQQHQPELSELCPDDYSDTKALAAIRKKYSAAEPTGKPDDIRSATNSRSLGVTGVNLAFLKAGATYKPQTTTTAEFKGVKYYALNGDDENVVLQKLGKRCKAAIAQWRHRGHGVYIPVGAYRADTVNITTKIDTTYDADIAVDIKKVKPGFKISQTDSSSVTVSGKNYFYKVLPSSNN
ncbi:hypothetical protein PVA19_11245 [Agrobacterium sp. CNPSo 3708]|uniref:hypothetical protein n=1 Tax=Agrobacterium sp. CNPSo 3708 TaxID=3028150 RepID=UPI0023636B45|nr:hypothetical protein [Agrobacterium sp. CNPSo 3708]MDD1498987.1 hypothetical protein [Agrobacterium sp. CNPSo 3708]